MGDIGRDSIMEFNFPSDISWPHIIRGQPFPRNPSISLVLRPRHDLYDLLTDPGYWGRTPTLTARLEMYHVAGLTLPRGAAISGFLSGTRTVSPNRQPYRADDGSLIFDFTWTDLMITHSAWYGFKVSFWLKYERRRSYDEERQATPSFSVGDHFYVWDLDV
jgi:hypothetical protein